MTDKEAMKLALDALENSVDLVVEDAYNAEQLYGNYPTRQGKVGGLKILADQHKEAITALKERLLEASMREVQRLGQEIEQEPVAWKWHQAPVKTSWGHDMVVADLAIDKDNTVSVYCERDQTTKVEAMLSTTPQRTEQEPVAMVESVATVVSESGNKEVTMSWWHEPALPVGTKLYTHPSQNVIDKSAAKRIATTLGWEPKRGWVDVPDEEIKILWIQYRAAMPRYLCFAKALLARSKEKNNG